MKKTKIQFVMLALLSLALSGVNAATNVLYEASDSPGSDPDSGTIDVWTVTGDGGAGRSYLQGTQDGSFGMWTVWDLNGGAGTYADHTFVGGALLQGQTVSIDYAHNTNINTGNTIGIRFMNGTTSEVEFVFIGGDDWFSKYDTGSGVYEQTSKRYDNYDLFQVKFSLTGSNSYVISVTEGSIADNGWKGSDDGDPSYGPVVATWEGTFTGSAIDGIQVYTEGGDGSDQWFDNLEISDEWLTTVHNYSPEDGTVDVVVAGLELSWDIPQKRTSTPGVFAAATNLESFNLYLSVDDPNLAGVEPIVVSEWGTNLKAGYTPTPDLSKNSTVYWRVDSVYSTGDVVEGTPLSFDTELTKAIITSQSEYVAVDPGATAVIPVEVFTETEASYQWYKYVDGENDEMLTDGGDISGATTSELAIANAEVADEASFYCTIINSSEIPVSSDPTILAVKRKLAYWTFEDNNLDSIVPGSPASVIVGDPNFMSNGIVGDCIEFDSGVDFIYTELDKVSYFDNCDYNMTVSCWVKTDDTQDWCPLVAKRGEGEGWQLRHHGNSDERPCFTTRGTGNDDGTPANRTIYDDQWHYVVGTFDGSIKKVYIDGVVSVVYSSDDGSVDRYGDEVSAPINASISPVAIGGRVIVNEEELVIEDYNNTYGLFDEVEIYNYALDADTIAQIYANISGQDVCLGQMYDLSGNCIVDLADFAIIASEWLSDSIVSPELN